MTYVIEHDGQWLALWLGHAVWTSDRARALRFRTLELAQQYRDDNHGRVVPERPREKARRAGR